MKEIAFAAKKALSVLLCPLGMCLALLFAGLFLLGRKRNSRLGHWLIGLAAVWLLITSLPLTSFFLMRHLENMAGPMASPQHLKGLGVRTILVLGGGGHADWRVVEGIRLWRHLPESRLILSGGRKGKTKAISELPLELGVVESALHVRSGAADTSEESGLFAATVGKAPFALVTSAYHMPRAMRQFRAMELNPIPAPCEHRASERPVWPTCLLPNADALLSSQHALHEYLGMVWQALRHVR